MKAIKKPIHISFRYATIDELVSTLEGVVPARIGDAIVTGVKGEVYPITRPKFDATYEVVSEGVAFKKPVVVEVEQMLEPFSVTVGWSSTPITGEVGDYRIEYAPGDYGVVNAAIFHETYDIVED